MRRAASGGPACVRWNLMKDPRPPAARQQRPPQPSNRLLVRGVRQLVTLRGPVPPRRGLQMQDLSIIADGAMLIENGRIVQVGPSVRIENLAAARTAQVLDCPGNLIVPGFVDAYSHLIHGPPRLDDFESRVRGLNGNHGMAASVRALRAATASRLRFQGSSVLRQCAALGTTTLEARSGYGLDESAEYKVLRLFRALNHSPLGIVPTYYGPMALPPEFEGRPADFVDFLVTRTLPRIAQRRLASIAAACCGRESFSPDLVVRFLSAAHELGFALRVSAETEMLPASAALAADYGARSLDLCGPIDAESASRISRSASMATVLPGPAFHLGHGRFPTPRIVIDSGGAVALGSGFNPGTSPTCSMPLMIALACCHMRMTPAEALTAATINAANVLGVAGETGSLEHGKWADFVVLEAGDYREIPYYFGMNLVAMTVRRGKVVYRKER